ncbi:MAG: 30S ribosomal protein S18 [Planctomycetes bacterium]|nr:30S ribosomal protein S18 [Planctomycetota bacterium]
MFRPEGGPGGGRFNSKKAKDLKKKKKKKARILLPVPNKLSKEQKIFIDYKDIETLQKFVSGVGKLLSRKRGGTTARTQQMVREAVKLARFMALMPYVAK